MIWPLVPVLMKGVFQGEWQRTKIPASLRQLICFLTPTLASLEVGFCFILTDEAELEAKQQLVAHVRPAQGRWSLPSHALPNISINSVRRLFSVMLYSSDKRRVTRVTGWRSLGPQWLFPIEHDGGTKVSQQAFTNHGVQKIWLNRKMNASQFLVEGPLLRSNLRPSIGSSPYGPLDGGSFLSKGPRG